PSARRCRRAFGPPSGILPGPDRRHVRGRPAIPALSRRAPRVLRQIPPPQRQEMHFPMQLRRDEMNHDRHYDVIIIGTGAGGGTLARKLAPTGKKVLLLERGDYVPREKDNWSTRAVNVQGKYQTREIWKDRDGKDLHPHTNYCVGG